MELPSEKAQKYDRQLRLWGDHGQTILESSEVCLIHATATGCEILKNLILPGIGSFTIIDDCIVTEQDLGTNFFLHSDSVNQKRGQVACQYLKELNEDVDAQFLDESVSNLIKKSPEMFLKYSLVILTSTQQKILLELDDLLYRHGIPLLVCQSYGMIGYIRIVAQNHAVIESHPENSLPDLRLTQPFPELVTFCDSIDLESLDKKAHSHIPWLVIVYKFLQKYRDQNNGQLPKSYKQKKELKALIEAGVRCNEFGVPEDEENFQEAAKAVNTALTEVDVSPSLRQILDDDNASNITSESSNFWVMVRALREFVGHHGYLPLRGTLPDMTSDSDTYIALQQVYKKKALEHIRDMQERITSINKSRQPCEPMPLSEITLFCKNTAHLTLVSNRSMRDEHSPATANKKLLASGLEVEDNSENYSYYILLRAADMFYTKYNRYPGCYDDRVEADIPLLRSLSSKLLQDLGLSLTIREDFIHEMCSYGAAELHAVASFMGGIAAQEAIKVLTCQYIPVKNTLIYNACTQTTTALSL